MDEQEKDEQTNSRQTGEQANGQTATTPMKRYLSRIIEKTQTNFGPDNINTSA